MIRFLKAIRDRVLHVVTVLNKSEPNTLFKKLKNIISKQEGDIEKCKKAIYGMQGSLLLLVLFTQMKVRRQGALQPVEGGITSMM